MRNVEIESARVSVDTWENVWKDSLISLNSHPEILNALRQVVDIRGTKILEIGCGRAVDSVELFNLGARAFAVDYSLTALHRARQVSTLTKAEILLAAGDTFYLPYSSGSFHLVFSQGLMEHFSDPKPAIREQLRVIKKEGFICIDVPQTYSLYTTYKRWLMYRGNWFAGWETDFSLKQLEELLRSFGLKICKSYGYLYFPSLIAGFRNLHTFNERHHTPFWISPGSKKRIENIWLLLEKQRWYYSRLVNIGVIAQKTW